MFTCTLSLSLPPPLFLIVYHTHIDTHHFLFTTTLCVNHSIFMPHCHSHSLHCPCRIPHSKPMTRCSVLTLFRDQHLPCPLHHHHHQQPSSIRDSCGCPHDCGLMGREYRPCIPDSNSVLLLLKMERGCLKGSEYGADNHDDAFLPFSLPKSRGTSTSLSNYNTSPNKGALLKSLPYPPPMTTQPSSHALYPSTLPLEGQDSARFESDSASKSSQEEREDRCKSQCDDLLSLKFPKPSQRARLFEILLLLLVGAKRIKDVCDFCCCCGNECVDSGGSSSGQGSGGGSSSSGKKQQSNRSGSSSSSQRSGSGSSQRGGTGMGGRTHSGSSDSSDDNGDDDHNKRPRPPPNKEPKSKLDVSDDDDEGN